MKMDIIYVEWIDSTSLHGWNSPAEAKALKSDPCRTVGFLLQETDDAVTLVMSHTSRDEENGRESMANAVVIPKFAVTNRSCVTNLTSAFPELLAPFK